MNIPVGKIIIGLFVVMALIVFIALFPVKSNTTPLPSAPSPEVTPTPIPTPTPSPTPTPTPSPKYKWEIVDLTYKVTEENPSWWKFSWQAMVKNNTNSSVEFFITVNFLDKDGFIIEDDTENPIDFRPLEQRVIKGYSLIDTEIASDVKRIELGNVSAFTKK